MNKLRIFCETDNKFETFETLLPREKCPIDSSHTVRAGSLSRVGQSSSDYKVLRNNLIALVATEGFANLTLEEKKIASENFAVSKADRDTVHTIEEQIANGVKYHERSTQARVKRRQKAEAEVYNRILNGAEQADLMNDVGSLIEIYVNFGIEGTLEGDVPGLFDYLESRTGTPFDGAGLLQKTYTIEGMTVAQFSSRLMDIFKNGVE